eukprot:2194516-Lingulodinium_polyedra.AAC.1
MGRPGAAGFSPSALGLPVVVSRALHVRLVGVPGCAAPTYGPWLSCQVPAAGVQRASCARS